MKKNEHPLSFEEFEALYLEHLSDDDRPTCYIAYCRAEGFAVRKFGHRRAANYHTFRTMLWRARARRKAAKQQYETNKI